MKKIDNFITVPLKKSRSSIIYVSVLSPILEALLMCAFGMALSSSSNVVIIFLIVTNFLGYF